MRNVFVVLSSLSGEVDVIDVYGSESSAKQAIEDNVRKALNFEEYWYKEFQLKE